MDLFGDLPPPASAANSLYDDLPTDQTKTLKRPSEDKLKEAIDVKKVKIKTIAESTNDVYKLKSFIAERKGERDDMQDATVLMDDCTDQYKHIESGTKLEKVAFYGVFDGHGGNRASNFAKENLHNNIVNNFPKEVVENFDRELKKGLVKAFKETDESFIRQASKETPHWKDGSTAACILLINETLYVASIGDSKVVLVRRKSEGKKNIVPMTKDHSPTDYQERQRIQNAGGFVKDGRVQGVLEVSRAFGDARFKKYVIATPDIFKSMLTETDRYLIIACDGLWKAFKVTEAVEFIDDFLNDTDKLPDINDRYEKACKEIANEAVRRCSGDNVTVALISISCDKHDADVS